MYHLVLAYRRSTQQVLESQSFTAWEPASDYRKVVDSEHWGDWDVEVVTLAGESQASLELTHGRYFASTDELTERLRESASEPVWGNLRSFLRSRKAAASVA